MRFVRRHLRCYYRGSGSIGRGVLSGLPLAVFCRYKSCLALVLVFRQQCVQIFTLHTKEREKNSLAPNLNDKIIIIILAPTMNSHSMNMKDLLRTSFPFLFLCQIRIQGRVSSISLFFLYHLFTFYIS